MFEIRLEGRAPEGSESLTDFQAVFTLNGKKKIVTGFYAGNQIYKVRFYPQEPGTCTWEITSSLSLRGELTGIRECEPATGHGMVRAKGLHFRYEDGSRYMPFGTTVYALLYQKESLINQTMKTLKESTFNKVRMCVFPKHFDFNDNEPELFPFEKQDRKFDINTPCYSFWDKLEQRIAELGEAGIEVDLILFHPYDCWGFSELSKEECKIYLDYLVRRISAYPNVWWSLANEYDLLEHFAESWWTEFAEFIHEKDRYGHLLSNHNCLPYWDFSNKYTTHCSIQDVCVSRVPDFQEKYKKPVIFDEVCYEGNLMYTWGNISGFELVNRFWICCVLGGYCTHGETFMDTNDILWWSKGGELHGESPKRIAFLKQILEELPEDIEPVESPVMSLTYQEVCEKVRKNEETDRFFKILAKMSEVRFQDYKDRFREICGHCGKNVYLWYYGRQCISVTELELPEEEKYDIEIIDVWEMTREKVLSEAGGKITVELPGKEGIAVIATRHVHLDIENHSGYSTQISMETAASV